MKRMFMVSKYLVVMSLYCFIWVGCVFHGSCRRTIEGSVKGSQDLKGLNVRLCHDYGSGYDGNCDSGEISSDGIYKFKELIIDPQGDCYNDCSKKNTTLPYKIIAQVYKKTSEGDSVLKEVSFSCEDDFTFKGDDIILPEIVLDE